MWSHDMSCQGVKGLIPHLGLQAYDDGNVEHKEKEDENVLGNIPSVDMYMYMHVHHMSMHMYVCMSIR